MIKLTINNKSYEVDVAEDMPLLWVLRDSVNLTGTKFGCGLGLCGACTVLVDGEAVRSCSMPVQDVQGKKITTIEGISKDGMHPIQTAWIEEQVPQCGYCQPGQIMSAIALLKSRPNPTSQNIDDAMSGNICRCGTYLRIKKAIQKVATN